MNLDPIDLQVLKTRIKGSWMAGDYSIWGTTIAEEVAAFVARLNLMPGIRMLDVACGTGNCSLPAARLGAQVTGVDIAPALLDTARVRATAEGLTIQFDEGDAEALPYDDGRFDLVTSTFGVIFVPRPHIAGAELVRVCRSGGRIALANWTPDGFVAELFKTQAAHMPHASGIPKSTAWGDERIVRDYLGDGIAELRCTPRTLVFKFPYDVAQVVEFFRRYSGATKLLFDRLDLNGQAALRRDLEALWTTQNRATDGTTLVEATYLEVIALRAS